MKRQILEKAAEMYLTLGFKSVTMDDIANELGISKKTIYEHYKNKNELVEATAMDVFEKISSGIEHIYSLGKNAIEETFEIRNFMMTQLNNETSSPFHQLQKYFPKVFYVLRRKQFDKMQDCLRNNLTKGIESGLYRNDLDVEFISRMYFIGVTGIRDSEVFPIWQYDPRTVTRNFIEYHLHAIVSADGLKLLEKLMLTRP